MAIKVRQEINILDRVWAPDPSALSEEFVLADSDYFNGTVTAYLEVVAKNSNVSILGCYLDRDDNLAFSSKTNVATCAIPGSTASWTRIRSSSFSLDSTDIYYRIRRGSAGGSGDVQVK